jgi:hypothetical protein
MPDCVAKTGATDGAIPAEAGHVDYPLLSDRSTLTADVYAPISRNILEAPHGSAWPLDPLPH